MLTTATNIKAPLCNNCRWAKFQNCRLREFILSPLSLYSLHSTWSTSYQGGSSGEPFEMWIAKNTNMDLQVRVILTGGLDCTLKIHSK